MSIGEVKYCSSHDLPLMDLSVGWFLRQKAALFHLRHTYDRPPTQFLERTSLHLRPRHRKGQARLTALQGASRGITWALQGPLTRNECSLNENDVVMPPGGLFYNPPVGIIAHMSSKPICGICRFT